MSYMNRKQKKSKKEFDKNFQISGFSINLPICMAEAIANKKEGDNGIWY